MSKRKAESQPEVEVSETVSRRATRTTTRKLLKSEDAPVPTTSSLDSEPRPNPLENSLVLSNLFRLMSPKDLGPCRAVSRLWNYEASKVWRPKVYVKIAKKKKLTEGRLIVTTGNSELRRFLSFHKRKRFDFSFCTSFLIKEANITRALSIFWRSFGPWMTQLQLVKIQLHKKDGTVNDIQKAVFQWTPNLKVLEMVHVKAGRYTRDGWENRYLENPVNDVDYDAEDGDYEEIMPQINLTSLKIGWNTYCLQPNWLDIFKRFPGISNLELGLNDLNKMEEMLVALKGFNETTTNQKIVLTSLTLSRNSFEDFSFWSFSETSSNQLESLIKDLKLPLEHFSIDEMINWPGSEPKNVARYLACWASTLKSLEVKALRRMDNIIETRMPVLEKVKVSTNYAYPNNNGRDFTDLAPKSIDFLRFIPNVKILEINDEIESPWRTLYLHENEDATSTMRPGVETAITKFRYNFRSRNVRFGYHYGLEGVGAPEMLEYFITCLPQLTVLEIPMSKSTFRVVCENWPLLTELSAADNWKSDYYDVPRNDVLDDDAITGISGTRPELSNEEMTLERKPNITDLKNLKVFRLGSKVCQIMTDRSILEGFLKVEGLNCLEFCAVQDQFSVEALQQLNAKVPNVIINYDEKYKRAINGMSGFGQGLGRLGEFESDYDEDDNMSESSGSDNELIGFWEL